MEKITVNRQHYHPIETLEVGVHITQAVCDTATSVIFSNVSTGGI